MDILGTIKGFFGGGGGGQSAGSSDEGGDSGMVNIKDIAASASASFASSFQSTMQTKFGNNIRNLGSGTIMAKIDETQTTDAKNATEATATSSNAKADQGGYAESTAVTQKEGGAFSTSGASGWLNATTIGIAGAIGVVAIITLIFTRRRRK
jgi:hypothetical protein